MKATEWKNALLGGALASLDLYADPESAAQRYIDAIDRFEEVFFDRDLFFSESDLILLARKV